MPSHRLIRTATFIVILILASALLAGCSGFTLAADITPPPNYTPPAPAKAVPVAASTAFPLLPPDPKNGEAIYAVKCLPCHGATGMGDGPQAGNLPARPAEIGSPAVARRSRPADWYQIVTDGNLEKFMPGFQGSLDDRQRWDVVAYVYTLSVSPQQLQEAKALYTDKCASCHGASGRADGPDAAGKNVLDWGQQERLSQFSADMLDQTILNGKEAMPAFADLSADQRWGLIAYARSLTHSAVQGAQAAASTPTPAAGEAAATPEVQATPASGTPAAFVGKVTLKGTISGDNGLQVPGGLEVSLLAFEGMTQVADQKTASTADGSFSFEVDNKDGLVYMVQVTYNNFTFNSDILHAADITSATADVPVTIYATTSDTASLAIDRMHIFFDFSQPAKVQVAELFIISNNSEQVVVAGGPDQPVLSFKLPEGAANLQFDNGAIGDRYVQTADGFGDLAAIAPGQGQHQILFSYELPYNGKADVKMAVPMAVNAAVIMMPQSGVKLKSDQFQASGSRDVQGMTYELYTASGGVAAGASYTVNLSGNPLASGADAGTAGGGTNGLLIGLGVFGLALIGAGVWLFRQRSASLQEDESEEQEDEGEPESEEALLDAILALDDLHQAGKLPDDAYAERRAALKERLRAARGGR